MEKLDNGKYLVNGVEYDADQPMNMSLAECPCGWSTIDNEFSAYFRYQDHACLTKAGKPRKQRLEGRMRAATMAELFEFEKAQEVSA